MSVQVTSLHPVKVGAEIGVPKVIKNISAQTIYYRNEPFVSSATNDGNLTENQEVTVTTTTWFVAKEGDGELRVTTGNTTFPSATKIGTENLETGAVTEPKLGTGAVTEAKLGTAAVTVVKTKVKTDAVPSGTESLTAVAGTSGVGRIISFGYSAKKEANAKVKLIHNLGTTAVVVAAYTTATKVASERLAEGSTAAGAIEKVKVESANEVLITLAAAEPGSKEEFIYVVTG